MKPKKSFHFILAVAGSSLLAVSSASAQTNYFWDQNGATAGTGGTEAWDTTSNFWRSGSDTGALGAWVNAGAAPFNTATFGGTAGTVTLGTGISAGGLTFNTTGYVITGNTLTLAGSSTPIINATTGTSTIASIVAGTNGLQKNGGGSLVLNNASNSFSGGIVLNGGTLSFGANTHLGAASNAISVIGNSTLAYTGGVATLNRAIDINSGVTLGISGVSSTNYSGALTGSGTLNNSGSSQPYIFSSANNTFTGTVNAAYGMTFASLGDASTYNLGNSAVGFAWTGGAKTFSTRSFNVNAAGGTAITNNGSGALVIETNLAVSGGTGGRTLNLGGTYTAGTNRFGGNIADVLSSSPLGITKTGDNSTWALSGTNTYTGATILGAGGAGTETGFLTFQGMQALSNSTSLNQTQATTNTRWGTIKLLDDSATPASRSGVNLNWSIREGINPASEPNRYFMRVFVGNNSTANGGTSSSTQTGSTIQVGNLNLTENTDTATGQGLWVTGANGYRLQIADVNVNLLSGTAVNHVATLRGDNPITVTGTVRQANDAAVGSNTTLSLEGSATSNLISGAIRNSAGGRLMNLSKAGTGTWTLSGTNDYTGTTAISAGILRITGNSSAATGNVSVTGGSLGGSGGSLGGAVTVSSTGGIDLRDGSIGSLTLGSTLNITGAAGANNLRFDMGNGTGTSDSLIVAGATTVTTAGAAVVDLNWLGGASGRTPGTYTLIGGAGALDAADFAKFSLSITKAFGQSYTLVHDLVSDGGTGNLQVSATNVTAATPAAFWAGGGNNWSTTTNWRASQAGNDAVAGAPDYQTNVTFSTTTPTPANLTTNVLDTDFNINSLTFTNASGNATIAGPGALVLEAAAVNGNTAGNGINSLKTSGTNTISARVALASSQTWTVASGGTLAVSGVVSDFGLGRTLTKAGAGSLTLSGTNTYSGGTVISGGTLTANADANLGASTGGITFSGNSTLAMTGTISHNRQITLNSGVTATILSGAGVDYNNSAKVTGAGNLLFTQTGSGGRNLRFNSTSNDFTGTVSVSNTSGQQLAVFFNSLVDSASSGAGNIIMTMSGANGPNTFAYGSGAIAPLTLTNRRLELTGAATSVSAIFSNQSASQAITLNSNLLISSTGNKGLTLDAVAGPTNVFAGEIDNGSFSAATQVVSINKAGAGVWSLSSANNDFTGTISVINGTLNYASAGGSNGITFSNTTGGATLAYTGATDKTMSGAINAGSVTSGTVNLLSSGDGAVNYSNTANITAAGSGNRNLVLAGTNAGNNILAGAWVNNGSGGAATLTKNGIGKWILTNTNSYTGATVINGGTLQLGNGGTTGALTGTASIANSGNLTINRSNAFTQATDLSNKVISGSGSFTQAGAGTTTLSLVNTYTGATLVNGGVLVIASGGSTASGSAVSINNTGSTIIVNGTVGGTLTAGTGTVVGGSGTITGNTTISGNHSPGNSPGIITHTGDLTYNTGASVTWELISDAIGTRGTDYDGINVGGALAFNGATTINLVFDLASSTVNWNDTFWDNSYTGTSGWLLYSGATSLVGFGNLSVNVLNGFDGEDPANSFNIARPNSSFGLFQDNNNIYITYTVIPEPKAALLGSIGMLLLLRRRR